VKENQGKKGIATMKESTLHSEKVLKADPENIYAIYWLASAIGFADQANLADSTIKKLAEKIPTGRELPVPEGVPAYQEALSHWDKRGNLDETRRAMEIWERITQDDPQAFAAYAWLARAHYWLGENEETKEEREKLYHRGYEFGEKAVALRPRHSGANFWTGANLARYAKDGSFLRQARLAPEIFHYVKISIQEEPIYFYLGSSRYIGYCMAYAGSLTRKFLPILGFNPERVVPLLKLAAVFAPSYLETNQALAECTISLDDPVQARQSLEFVLGQDPKALPAREAENVLYQNKARKLIQTMKLE
jgi:tetratricopeptide (TPR) repeat protein